MTAKNSERDFDLLALGEVLLRLSPPVNERLVRGDTLEKTAGGAELNVVSGVSLLGLHTGIISKLPSNDLGTYVKTVSVSWAFPMTIWYMMRTKMPASAFTTTKAALIRESRVSSTTAHIPRSRRSISAIMMKKCSPPPAVSTPAASPWHSVRTQGKPLSK